jgi:hypothetical protein
MNKYLEKIASWKNPSKFVGYVSGATKRETGARVRHMEEAIANNHTLGGLQQEKAYADKETTKARLVAGGVAAAGAGAVAYGYKKVRDKQKQETVDRYNAFLKEGSSVGAAKELGSSAIGGVTDLLKRIGKTTSDLMNTAGGGKIKNHAVSSGMKYNSPDYKAFVKADHRDQVRQLMKKNPKGDRKGMIKEVGNLHRNQRDARIALGATAAAGVSGYGWHKARQALKKSKPNYY